MQRRVEPRPRGLSLLFTERWCGWEPASGHCKQPIFFPWQKPMLLSRQYHPMSPVGRTSLQFYNLLYQLDIDHHSAVKTSNMVPTCLPQHWKPLCAGLRIAAPESERDHSTIKWGSECHSFTVKPESERYCFTIKPESECCRFTIKPESEWYHFTSMIHGMN